VREQDYFDKEGGELMENDARRQIFVDKIKNAQELKALYENPTFQKLLTGMSERAYEYLKVIDNPASTIDEIKDALKYRQMILVFRNGIIEAMNEGERAQEELTKFLEWEKTQGEKKP
jgi:hypothetical protein